MKKVRYLFICGWWLFCMIPATAQKITLVYSGKLRSHSIEKVDSVKKEFSDLLDKVCYVNFGKSGSPRYIPDEKEVIVSQDHVIFKVTKNKKYTFVCTNKQEIQVAEYSYLGKVYQIELPDITFYWKIKDLEFAKRLADDLVYFQNMLHMKDFKNFDAIAAKYLAMKEKPLITEEARKYIVQANAMTQEKNYKKAIETYDKALEVDPANPMVYNNQALLFAMIGQFEEAIDRMKKYLKLEPGAADARTVQDKIYEWEASITK